MLQLIGKCLGVNTEIVQGPTGPFESVTIRVASGEGFNTHIMDARPSRDFPKADLPREGEQVTLNVVVGVYSGKNGAGYRLTALSREHKSGQRVSPVASAS